MNSDNPTMPPDAEIEKRFSYHAPVGDKVQRHEAFREKCKALAYHIKTNLPAGREQAVALTHLEDVMMWGNAAIARN